MTAALISQLTELVLTLLCLIVFAAGAAWMVNRRNGL
jgi:hypothetical protein